MTDPTSDDHATNATNQSTSQNPPTIPSATTVSKKRMPISIVWLIPLIAALTGGWLAISSYLNQGPTITITFHSAEGLEAGRTKIKYRDVEVGTVQAITLAKDPKDGVVITAKLDKQAEDYLVTDTQFWVVKPRIVGNGLSGFSTLLSGSYIGLEAGHTQKSNNEFVGLEVPPILTSGLAGKTFKIKASDLGSIDYGTPIYFRRINVGEVIAYKLDSDGQNITTEIFIHAPYDKYVTKDTRFWSASGLDISMDASGIKLTTESITSVLFGGIAFADPPSAIELPPAPQGQNYTLFNNRADAFKQQDTQAQIVEMTFRESVHGLSVGAPVEFRGIPIGEVIKIGVHYDKTEREITIPVLIRLYPDRLLNRMDQSNEDSDAQRRKNMVMMVNNGLRGQLRTGSLLTGQLFIIMDFFPTAQKASLNLDKRPFEIPTVTSGLQELQTSINSIVNKLDKIPFEQLSSDLHNAIETLNSTIQDADKLLGKVDKEIAPQLSKTLMDAQNTLDHSSKLLSQDAPAQQELRDTLREVSRAAQSVRALTDYLERHPESLIRGKDSEEGTK